MEYKLIRTAAELSALGPEWNRLLENSPVHVPFLRHEYQVIWWDTRGGGEWPQAELAVVTAHDNGTLVGIAPLFATNNKAGEAALMLIGSIEISDYLDLLAIPARLDEFVNGLLAFLAGQAQAAKQDPAADKQKLAGNDQAANQDPAAGMLEAPGKDKAANQDRVTWQVLDWYNILESSATLPSLENAARRAGWKYELERCQASPYIQIPGDWEAYLASIDKKQRHEIRRKMRRFETADVPTRWYIVEDPATLESESQAFLDLMALDPEKASFLTGAMRTQMMSTIRCAFEQGCLQLAFLEVNGKKAAAYLNFDYQDTIWVYNSGLDPSYKDYSPGWVLLGYLLEWANEHKRREFDFLRGQEDYKYRFGAVDRFVMRARVIRN